MVDSVTMLDEPHTLRRLMEVQRYVSVYLSGENLVVTQLCFTCRSVVAPLMIRPFRLFSNFWGDIASNGFYARSWDYQEIVQRNRM